MDLHGCRRLIRILAFTCCCGGGLITADASRIGQWPPALIAMGRLRSFESTSDTDLLVILSRAAAYVDRFEGSFSTVLMEEHYSQSAHVKTYGSGIATRTLDTERQIESEMLFSWIPQDRKWLDVREVHAVDGSASANGSERLQDILSHPEDRLSRLRHLRDEGARFNIGNIERNFNEPTFVLQFLDRSSQYRFEFERAGETHIHGIPTDKVTFVETFKPSFITGEEARDLLVSGSIWIASRTDDIIRTQLLVRDPTANTAAEVTVDFSYEPRLRMSIPTRMTEHYDQRILVRTKALTGGMTVVTREERIACSASYDQFRRFETSGRLVSPPRQ